GRRPKIKLPASVPACPVRSDRMCLLPRHLPVLLVLTALPLAAAEPQFTAEQLEVFEREVKPILKANCVVCHGGEKKIQRKFDSTNRAGAIKGGENGAAISLDKPDESPLLEAINYGGLEMPPKGKLPQAQIDVLTKWVKLKLPWPEGDKGV